MRKRTTSYTEREMSRVKCFRCKENPAAQQWQICSDGNAYRAICRQCDIDVNRLILEFMGFPNVDEMIARYEETL